MSLSVNSLNAKIIGVLIKSCGIIKYFPAIGESLRTSAPQFSFTDTDTKSYFLKSIGADISLISKRPLSI